ncbi:cysteine--tRNA ligase [Candidatus Pantoea edessiphila]|uniref:Cysteine--tRNA ligase n=1 Tax=Candidatus Pantoea edessiphila TaxID=2044610 RepID=A0A2P5SXH9_9GAMM|nr:cysteine--tRNA ligase [Candidatus Pantoea edessiphila]MBK4775867.1 cysteine--tRNA ligase [Pantoea sp. Edef]PPI87035.1 cysteine--tRNA ligase [Candidatus Pantoea edessiphila]
MLKIYNTISHKKEIFTPICKNKISMYVCGVTVYDVCHIGHARTFVNFDVIARYLRYMGYDLNYVRNITDIDDKIIKRAKANNENIKDLTDRMIKNMHDDFRSINLLVPSSEPRATNHILEIIEFINQLINSGYAYIADNGDVVFEVNKHQNYGILSNQKLKQLQNSNRNETLSTKRNSIDFVLWKISKKNEPYWSSPWGNGRPGWHIECSAMIHKKIGSFVDIHGGGSDLMFPHHENELAQSICAHKNTVINYWIHTGMMMIDNKKMSKSLGNFLTLRDLLSNYDPESIRYFLLSSHYRSPINYSANKMHYSNIALKRLYTALLNTNTNNIIDTNGQKYTNFESRFRNAMNDDFNIPEVYSIIFDMAHTINSLKKQDIIMANTLAFKLREIASVLGILQQDPEQFLQKNHKINSEKREEINHLIKIRNQARKLKNWQEADIARDKLNDLGIVIEDNLYQSTWRHR